MVAGGRLKSANHFPGKSSLRSDRAGWTATIATVNIICQFLEKFGRQDNFWQPCSEWLRKIETTCSVSGS